MSLLKRPKRWLDELKQKLNFKSSRYIRDTKTNKMKQFMYLLRGGDRMDEFSPEEMEAHMGQWKAWMGGLAEQGNLAGGLPLGKEGKQVKGKSKVVTDGPFAAGKEVVGGYIIVNANNMDEAIELSKGCPIFETDDANLEVREMMDM